MDKTYERLQESLSTDDTHQKKNAKMNEVIITDANNTIIYPMLAPTDIRKKNKKNRFSTPAIIGASSGMIWVMHNGFIPVYNSFFSQLFAVFYAPALVGYLAYKLSLAVQRKHYHAEHPDGLKPAQMEAMEMKCQWLGYTMALSLIGSQLFSKVFFYDGLTTLVEKSTGAWSGMLINQMPLEFHLGMMVASAVGFALCFAGMAYYQKNKTSSADALKVAVTALVVGLCAGAGLYVSNLLPGMNVSYGWNIPNGAMLIMTAIATAAAITLPLSLAPSLVDVSVDVTNHTSTGTPLLMQRNMNTNSGKELDIQLTIRDLTQPSSSNVQSYTSV